MDLTEGSETSAKLNLTPGKYPKENIQVSEHGENLKSRILEEQLDKDAVCHQFCLTCTSSECLTTEALEWFGDFEIGGQIINTEKYADDLVLLATEEMVLQDMIDKLIEIGRCHGMAMNMGKKRTKIMRIPNNHFQ
jgi:hypothetical protein